MEQKEDSLEDSVPLARCDASTHGNRRLLYLTCKACQRAGMVPPIWKKVNSLQTCHLREHANCQKHKKATSDPKTALTLSAPPVEDFQRVLRDVLAHKANGDEGVRDVGKRHKIRKMKFCLAEAIRVRTRIALKNARSLTIHADGSRGRLVVRGQMCGYGLLPQRHLLGTENQVLHFDSSALGLAGAVVNSLRELATPLLGAPFLAGGSAPEVDTTLLTHMCNIVEVFNADAASDEQLAGRLLQTGNNVDSVDRQLGAVFRNMIVLSKDKPHGARRIIYCVSLSCFVFYDACHHR